MFMCEEKAPPTNEKIKVVEGPPPLTDAQRLEQMKMARDFQPFGPPLMHLQPQLKTNP